MAGTVSNVAGASWKTVVAGGLARSPAVPALRALTRARALPWSLRTELHRRVAKHLPLAGRPTFAVQPPLGPTIRFGHGSAADYLWWLGTYEPASTNLFCALARDSALILDVGARDGIYALFAYAANPKAHVIAFEVEPEAARMLRTNVAMNEGLGPGRVTVVEAALAAADGRGQLYLCGGNSSLEPGFRPGSPSITVTVRSGDAALAELVPGQPLDLVKIDTEATEPDVLAGLDDTIARDHPVILCEVLPGRTEDRLQAFATRHSYAAWSIASGTLTRLPAVAGDPTYRQPNVLLAPSTWTVPPMFGKRP